MLSLACVVVNDGTFVLAKIEGAKTVHDLTKMIKEEAMLKLPVHALTLFLAKTDDGEWLHLSVDDLAKLHDGQTIDAVESVLTTEPIHPNTALNTLGFPAAGVIDIEAVHVLVFVSANRWDELPSGNAKTFTLDRNWVLDLATKEEGTLVCTKALSTAFHAFGGFPTAIFVRKEMQIVWTILRDNYVGARPRDVHYVLMGSPGVGKSALLLLLCCYLATHRGYWIFFSRTLMSEQGSPYTDTLLIFRGTQVTGYPGIVASDLDKTRLSLDVESDAAGKRFLVVGDGYKQEDMKGDLRIFISNHLLSTSAQFQRAPQDCRELLALPAWSRSQLEALAKELKIAASKVLANALKLADFVELASEIEGVLAKKALEMKELTAKAAEIEQVLAAQVPATAREIQHCVELANTLKIDDFAERYWYSGGSVREFQRDLIGLKDRIKTALTTLAKETEIALEEGYGSRPNSSSDSIRRLFVPRLDDAAMYTLSSEWLYIVDIPAALKYLAIKWQLKGVFKLRRFAETLENPSLHGQVFEVLVHKLAHDKALKLHVSGCHDIMYLPHTVTMTSTFNVTMGNGTDDYISFPTKDPKWAGCLTFLQEKAKKKMYWHPDYLQFPAIDSILITAKVVYYLQITVSSTHSLDWDNLRKIHDAVRANKRLNKCKFKYVVVTPRTTSWERYKKKTSKIPGISICLAHVNEEFGK